MAMVRSLRSDNDYHLRVVSYNGDPESPAFQRRVDVFLEDLYHVEVPGRSAVQPPLALSDCKLSEHDGRQVALIRFQLSPSAAHPTLDDALAEFCEKIFKPISFSIARILSLREAFLKRIEDDFEDDYLPDWVLASSFASFTGAIFIGALTEKDSARDEQLTVDSISGCITIATSILVNLATRVALANPDRQQQRWETSHQEFKRDMERVMHLITQPTVLRNDHRSNERLFVDSCAHLYGAMAAAAKTYIANTELFLAYVKLHKEAHASMIANGVITGAYLASIGSAFSVTTTTATLPLLQSGKALGWLLLGELPVVQTTPVWFCPPLAALSVTGAVYFGWSGYQDKKKKALFRKKVDYHRKLKVFIVQAWKIAHITHALLRLVHCVEANRMVVKFVNDAARSEWCNVITSFNEAKGRTTSEVQLDPKYIMIFLDEQKRDFEAWHNDLLAHEAQIV